MHLHGKQRLLRQMSKLKEIMNFEYSFNVIGQKNNQISVSNADREIPTLELKDNAGNSVKLVSGIIRLPLDWDFSVCIGDR